jgi:hypothetical protein
MEPTISIGFTHLITVMEFADGLHLRAVWPRSVEGIEVTGRANYLWRVKIGGKLASWGYLVPNRMIKALLVVP